VTAPRYDSGAVGLGPHIRGFGTMLPFPLGFMIVIYLASLTIVSWSLATSEPAPAEGPDLLNRVPGQTR
jgi:hypothetical protein